jgi:hypothetical protein
MLLIERVDPPVFFRVTTLCTVVFRFTSPKSTIEGERLTWGGVVLTVRVNFWVAFGDTVLWALIVMLKTPPAVGVPPRVAVPFPLSLNVTPPGKAPVLVSDGVGKPVAVTVNVPGVPAVNTVLFALVIPGA